MDKKAIRHAEKRRVSTCRFADVIAETAIAKYRELTTTTTTEITTTTTTTTNQIVLAAVLVATCASRIPTCVSLGVGTKVVPRSMHPDLSRLRDLHAEILAVRGCRRLLWKYLVNRDLLRPEWVQLLLSNPVDASSVKFHLYCSSMPCGNACIRKWGKSQKEKFNDQLSAEEYPVPNQHPQFFAHARDQGQIAPLAKRDGSERHYAASLPPSLMSVAAAGCEEEGKCAVVLSCSDKICVWNALGFQGKLLHRALGGRFLMFETITIGRKFCRVHAERALCCRMEATNPFNKNRKKRKNIDNDNSSTRGMWHPSLMCTGVILDQGVYEDDNDNDNDNNNDDTNNDGDAKFSKECYWWIDGLGQMVCVDSTTGMPIINSNDLSTASFAASYREYSVINNNNNINDEYEQLKQAIHGPNGLLQDVPRSNRKKQYGFIEE